MDLNLSDLQVSYYLCLTFFLWSQKGLNIPEEPKLGYTNCCRTGRRSCSKEYSRVEPGSKAERWWAEFFLDCKTREGVWISIKTCSQDTTLLSELVVLSVLVTSSIWFLFLTTNNSDSCLFCVFLRSVCGRHVSRGELLRQTEFLQVRYLPAAQARRVPAGLCGCRVWAARWQVRCDWISLPCVLALWLCHFLVVGDGCSFDWW